MMSRGSAVPQRQLFWDAAGKLEQDIIGVDAPRNLSSPSAAEEGVPLPGILEGLLSREDRHNNAYEYVGALLGHSYRWLYTKDPIREFYIQPLGDDIPLWAKIRTRTVMLLWASIPYVSTSIALALFMAAEKQQQLTANRVDIVVSYSLLVGALALDVSSAATFFFSHLPAAVLHQLPRCIQPSWISRKKQWSQQLGKYNLIRSVRIDEWGPCAVECCVKGTPIAPIKRFILDTLLASGAAEEWAIASTRGRRALLRHRRRSLHEPSSSSSAAAATTLTALEETTTSGADLPTSVLILHIATDICYYHGDGGAASDDDQVEEHKQLSRQLSEYIMYLVFKCGAMLSFNSQVLHVKARREIQGILSGSRSQAAVMMLFEQESKYKIQVERHGESEEQQATSDSTMAEIPIVDRGMQDNEVDNDVNKTHMKKLLKNSQTLSSPVLPRACEVARELISIDNEAARWKLIAEVWAEMLFYVAPRCGGGFHYDRLSKGGEFVTHVLVLMYYFGPFMPPPDA